MKQKQIIKNLTLLPSSDNNVDLQLNLLQKNMNLS